MADKTGLYARILRSLGIDGEDKDPLQVETRNSPNSWVAKESDPFADLRQYQDVPYYNTPMFDYENFERKRKEGFYAANPRSQAEVDAYLRSHKKDKENADRFRRMMEMLPPGAPKYGSRGPNEER